MGPITAISLEFPVFTCSMTNQALTAPVSSRAYALVIPAFHGATAGMWLDATTRKPGASRPTSVSTQ